ncbi:bacterioferritin-associated ferredoxin [Permianibacter sp. IMCC34836]|uniref:bacterioferritin-associated ferredoxin n=1 Tax=Permianibacter fluminis TaxID=2738515 RepID=UPI0015577DE0|nr:bacterioferritin-associated ferredoxin [Permianibacter fluminis]NQD37199.1 bacterioferritin-associated ferredoxin [Permianibacter fluminis]
MYVCLCKAVTDRQIREAVEQGASSMRDLARELGVATQCGKCGCDARELLKYCLDELPDHVKAA